MGGKIVVTIGEDVNIIVALEEDDDNKLCIFEATREDLDRITISDMIENCRRAKGINLNEVRA